MHPCIGVSPTTFKTAREEWRWPTKPQRVASSVSLSFGLSVGSRCAQRRRCSFKTNTAAKFEKIFLIPFSWMDVSDAEFDIAFTQHVSAKDFALDIGLAFGLRPSIPD